VSDTGAAAEVAFVGGEPEPDAREEVDEAEVTLFERMMGDRRGVYAFVL